ncbi:udp n-acetylglucosamine o-acyltransferase [Pochonia chlamydosporia 170]|uniref:Udp n-acetylglucosamine o-acyltransferase n=1 Tax=Pochonia chlamydosporia 170 TaxID=1380566 RepID=A0A179G0E8_METCM|nr:udp n-acetylglucosamine o-acyltransferase [Pochonia chlamydosporia 170]OAQ71322.1 udp n-acetylglucosamine o-acyltransferase [Pochonia chlamydosporia 170]
MAGSHVAHDCSIGDNVILVNEVALAGHVTVGHNTIISGLVGVAQRINIGQCAFIAAGTLVNRDVLPFSLVLGTGARTKGVSVEGLKRLGWSSERIRKLLYGMNLLFLGDDHGISTLLHDDEIKDEMNIIVSFMKKSENGICPAEGLGVGLRVNKI